MESALKDANSSDAERRIALKKKDEEIQGLKNQVAELDGYKSQIAELEGFKQKYDEVIETQNTALKTKWAEMAKTFDAKETDPNFDKIDKVKGRFNLNTDIDIDQVKQNISTYELLSETGFFEKSTPGKDKPPNGGGDKADYKSLSWVEATKPTS
jgi:hypothetical protein